MAKKPTTKPEPTPAKAGATGLGPDCRIALMVGDDSFLREEYTAIMKKAVEDSGQEVEVIRYDGRTALPVDVLDECRSFGLLARHKFVVVDDADEFIKEPGEDEDEPPKADAPKHKGAKRRDLMERYAGAPSAQATLVLRAESWRKGKIDKLIEQCGVIQPCDRPDTPKARAWAVKRAKQVYQRTLEPASAELLVMVTSGDLGRINSELAKLAAAVQENEPITEDLIERLVAPAPIEQKPWVFSEFLLNADPAPALAKLRELIDRSKADPVPLRWAAIDLAARVHLVSRVKADGDSPEGAMRQANKHWGPVADMARYWGHRLKPEAAAGLLSAAVEADFKGKTGQGDTERGVELLVLRFADAARNAS